MGNSERVLGSLAEDDGYGLMHKRDRARLVELYRVSGDKVLCPCCLRATNISKFRYVAARGVGKGIRIKNERWAEAHHLWSVGWINYLLPLRLKYVLACSWCHLGSEDADGRRRREESVLHNSLVWRQYENKKRNHNVLWFAALMVGWGFIIQLVCLLIRKWKRM